MGPHAAANARLLGVEAAELASERGAGAQGDALEGRGRLGGGLGCVCRSRRGRRCVRMTRGEGPGRALPVPLLLPLEAAPRRRDLGAGKRRAAAPACAAAPSGLRRSGPHALARRRALHSSGPSSLARPLAAAAAAAPPLALAGPASGPAAPEP